MPVAPWDEYTQWDYKVAYRRFLDDMDAEICPWKCFEKLELKDALSLNSDIAQLNSTELVSNQTDTYPPHNTVNIHLYTSDIL